MIDVNEIKAAVAKLDPADDSHWEADNSPKLSVVQILLGAEDLTSDDLDEAVGAYKRPGTEPVAAAQAPVTPLPPAQDRPVQVPDPRDPLAASTKLAAAREQVLALQVKIEDAEARRRVIDRERADLVEAKTVQEKLIEQYAPQVSLADSVKQVQAQTIERLKLQKEHAQIAMIALQASGTSVFPSKLDASLATRKKTPEQVANYTKFVHQNAVNKVAERG